MMGANREITHNTAIAVQFEEKTTYSIETAVKPKMEAKVETTPLNPVAVERYLVGNNSVP